MIFVLFCVWEDARIWGHRNSSGGVAYILNSPQGKLSVVDCSGLQFNPLHNWMVRAALCFGGFLFGHPCPLVRLLPSSVPPTLECPVVAVTANRVTDA